MKIRAIRLREVGCFGEPTVIEGLSGGLDVLADRNEAGKSTLLSALRACFLEKHSAQNKEIKELRPYRGGAPMIEVDFEVPGGAFRLRKQFLSGASAELREIGGGAVLARGAEAHERALDLIGVAGVREPFGLFWVAQGMSLDSLQPTEEDSRAVGALVEREVKTVTGGRRARAVIEEARRQRETLVSAARAQPRGAYADAIRSVETLSVEVDRAKAERDAVEALLGNLEVLRARRQALREPVRWAEFKQAVDKAEASLALARSAEQRWRAADSELRLARAERAAAARSLDDYDGSVARFAARQAEIDRCAQGMEELRREAEAAKASVESAEERLRVARARAEGAEALVARIGESERLAARFAERAEIVRKLDRANAIAAALAEADATLARNGASSAAVARIEERMRDIDVLRARLTAGAPSVSISYALGGEGRARTRAGPLVSGEALRVVEPLEIELDSIGTLLVRPSESVRDDLGELRDAQETMARALRDLGVGDTESVYRLKAEREAAEKARGIAIEQLAILAPEGIEGFRRRLEAMPERPPEPLVALPARAEAEASLSEARRAVLDLQMALAKVREDERAAELRVAAAATRLELLRAQHQADAPRLPPAEARDATRLELESAVLAAERKLADKHGEEEQAQRSLAAVGAVACFERRLEEARRAERAAADELSQCERNLHLAEGELKAAFNAGAGERLQMLEGRLDLARARVAGFAREVEELDLLISVLSQSAAEAKQAYFRPVVERLRPMLRQVLPSADMEFGEGFRPDRLVRGTLAEDLSRLSGGTREQIAVLVRLAFARLMADGGKPAPVILDDALGFAGDERLDPLFNVLHMASKRHQVLVLTCHARAFAPLGGNRVGLEMRDFA